MSELNSLLVFLSDPRLASYATGNIPAWLWSADATRILWGNPAAAAIFNAASPAALTGHTIDPKGSAALQIARLAGTLPHGAAPRLERLRGFGGRMGGALLCCCSRIALANRTPAILVVATEAAGPRLTLAEQAKRLLTECDDAVALFAPDGALLHATPALQAKLGRATSLTALNAAQLGETALATGRAEGNSMIGKVTIERIGGETSIALLATFQVTAVGETTAVAEAAAPVTVTAPPPQAPTLDVAAPPVPVTPPVAAELQATAEPEPQSAAIHSLAERRQPLRFVWQMDDDGRFTINSDEFKTLIGPQTAAALGQRWNDIAASLTLDPEGHVARAFASRDTWSGITVAFQVDGTDSRLPVELSGLPVFDRDRSFRGYRGFGVCREVGLFADLLLARRTAPAAPVALTAPIGPPATSAEPPRVEPPVFRDQPPANAAAPPSKNIVPFPAAPAEDSPTLTPVEKKAFSELASRLTARLRGHKDMVTDNTPEPAPPATPEPPKPAPPVIERKPDERPAARTPAADQRPILDRLPVGVLVYRLDKLIYANRAFLDWTGYGQLAELQEAGGLDALFVEPKEDDPSAANGAQTLSIATNRGDQLPVDARLFTSPWEGESALVLMLAGLGTPVSGGDRQQAFEAALRNAKAEAGELRAVLDTASDGMVVLDGEAHVHSANRSAEVMFGYQARELIGLPFATLFAQESQPAALGSLKRLREAGAAANPRDGQDVIGRRREGSLVPLQMTISEIAEGSDKFCAIFRDMTPWKKTESELLNAKRQAEKASSAKSDFLAKISHEIRTPLNAIIGFSEVMMQERFGSIGNERYKQYLKDIHTSGGHLVALLNDLLDLSKIEAGKLELSFSAMDLNEVTQATVALMQPQASRERIIIRTSLPQDLPQVTADVRSVRQIVLNLVSNSIKFTGAGGQVIVSTARGDDGDIVLRVRDTGVGMSEQDIAVALEPFRQLATSARWGSSGTGLGLPLTKALAEANRASFRIRSTVNTGTLVEVAFRGPRLAAE